MKRLTIALGIAAMMGLAAWLAWPIAIESIYGRDAERILIGPVRVTAFRIDQEKLRENARNSSNLGDPRLISYFPIAEGPIDMPIQTAAEIGRILSQSSSYDWDIAKGCTPMPGVRLDFVTDANESMQVLLCFECNILIAYRDGERVGEEDFDPARAELISLIKPLFPRDKIIQAL